MAGNWRATRATRMRLKADLLGEVQLLDAVLEHRRVTGRGVQPAGIGFTQVRDEQRRGGAVLGDERLEIAQQGRVGQVGQGVAAHGRDSAGAGGPRVTGANRNIHITGIFGSRRCPHVAQRRAVRARSPDEARIPIHARPRRSGGPVGTGRRSEPASRTSDPVNRFLRRPTRAARPRRGRPGRGPCPPAGRRSARAPRCGRSAGARRCPCAR